MLVPLTVKVVMTLVVQVLSTSIASTCSTHFRTFTDMYVYFLFFKYLLTVIANMYVYMH